MYKVVEFEYNKETLLALFNDSPKGNYHKHFVEVSLPNIAHHIELSNFFSVFDYITQTDRNVALQEITSEVAPYISPGNNGLIIFPILGALEVSFYNYIPTTDHTGRPQLLPKESTDIISEITATRCKTIVIDKPTAINGLVVHSYKPLSTPTIVFCLKIQPSLSWNELLTFLG